MFEYAVYRKFWPGKFVKGRIMPGWFSKFAIPAIRCIKAKIMPKYCSQTIVVFSIQIFFSTYRIRTNIGGFNIRRFVENMALARF